LTDEEFGRLTFNEFELLSRRLDERRKQGYICAGIVAATIANVNRDTKNRPEPFSPMDFVPGYKPVEEQRELEPLTPAEQVEAFKALMLPPASRVIRVKN
jgi:hypothetical protein